MDLKNATQLGSALATNPNTAKALGLDDRKLSFGPMTKAPASNLLNEGLQPMQFNWRITNSTTVNQHLVFAPVVASGTGRTLLNLTQFGDIASLVDECDGTYTVIDGLIVDDEPDLLKAESMDSSLTIEAFLRYCATSPTRILGMSLTSTIASSGEKDKSNYANIIKTFYATPFDRTQVDQLNLRPLQQGGANFNPDMLDVNFQKEGKKVILSNSNFFRMTVNADTILDMTIYIGAQMSQAQELYRIVNAGDKILKETGLLKK